MQERKIIWEDAKINRGCIMKKRVFAYFMSAMLCVSALSACGSKVDSAKEVVDNTAVNTVESTPEKTDENSGTNTGKIKVVSTIFPQYDWVKQVVGDKADNYEFTLLLDKGVDLHSYQPTADDIAKISDSDLFIYVGGESDGWVDDALKEARNKNLISINLLKSLGDDAKEEELVEGMQDGEHHHDHDDHDDHENHDHDDHEHHDHDDHDDHDHHDHEDHEDHEHHDHDDHEEHEHHHDGEIEYDEHVWLSLDNAELYVELIRDALIKIDPVNEEAYKNNAREYKNKLDNLDHEFEHVVDNAKYKTVLFGDRFPFRYLVDDYDLKYYAAFVGCSAETEASFETISFLSNKVNDLGLGSILTIEKSDKKIANTIKSNTNSKNQDILEMNSMQSITASDVAAGITYYDIMLGNLEVLKSALNK